MEKSVWIENENGDKIIVVMREEGGIPLGTIFVEGIPYHVFIVNSRQISPGGDYILDRDPDYCPKRSETDSYLAIAPYAE